MSNWVKFTGSEEQISEILGADTGWKVKFKFGDKFYESNVHYGDVWDETHEYPKAYQIVEYMLCNRHPHADMIIEWARTGREVYWFNPFKNEWELKLSPHWFSTDKYSFNPDGDGK